MVPLDFHFVAFIDILGFSSMVKSDCEGPDTEVSFISKLLEVHEEVRSLFKDDASYSLTQFSDSIVLNRKYEPSALKEFIDIIARFQYALLTRGLLCRGGIAFGKHFSQGDFIFSAGLIESYLLEKNIARFPRIVVSKDLLDLISIPPEETSSLRLLRQDDGIVFVDFLRETDLSSLHSVVESMENETRSAEASIREKILWLTSYFDYCASDESLTNLSSDRFSVFN